MAASTLIAIALIAGNCILIGRMWEAAARNKVTDGAPNGTTIARSVQSEIAPHGEGL